ncbi:hypothetical protein BD413DRAFT_229168 [Trametes elegans]|nr:hypothetical protein BD413DRAFT_229168 [Trametes elegans]
MRTSSHSPLRLLPVPLLLLPGLVRVERATVRAALRVPEVTLRTLALRLLPLLALRPARLARPEPLRVEARLPRLLHPAPPLRALAYPALPDADTNADAGPDVLHAHVAPVRLVRRLGRPPRRPLAQRRPRRRPRRLPQAHEALHALRSRAVQRLVLAVLARRQPAPHVHVLPDTVLRVVLVPELVVRVRRVLLPVQALPVRRLRLHRARALLPRRRRRRLRPGRALEYRRVLHERLRHRVARVVRRAVVLALRVGVVVRQRRRVALLRALTRVRLTLAARLRRRRVLLRGRRVRGRQTGCTVRLLRAGQALEVVVTEHAPVPEPGGARVRVVKVLLLLLYPQVSDGFIKSHKLVHTPLGSQRSRNQHRQSYRRGANPGLGAAAAAAVVVVVAVAAAG